MRWIIKIRNKEILIRNLKLSLLNKKNKKRRLILKTMEICQRTKTLNNNSKCIKKNKKMNKL